MKVSGVREFTLLFLVFSIPFLSWDGYVVFGFISILKLGLLLAFLFLLLDLAKMEFKISLRELSLPVFVLLVLWFFLILSSFWSLLKGFSGFDFHFGYLNIVFLYFLFAYELNENPAFKDKAVKVFVFSVCFVGVLIQMGIGVHSGKDSGAVNAVSELSRVWFLGMNPNILGAMAGLSVIFSVNLLLHGTVNWLAKLLLFVSLAISGSLLVQSGSAGAFIGLLISLVVLVFARRMSLRQLLLSMLVFSCTVGIVLSGLMSSEYLSQKLMAFFSYGETSGRTLAWKYSVDVIADNFLTGVGGSENVGKFFAGYGLSLTSAHNLFLDMFMWGGVFTFLLFSAFLGLVFRNCLFQLKFHNDSLNIAVFLFLLSLLLKAGGALGVYFAWLFLALITPVVKPHNDLGREFKSQC